MRKTYIDTQEWLKEIIEVNYNWKKEYIEVNIEETKYKTEKNIDIDNNELFDKIYNNFNIESPLENESIVKIYSWRNKFDFFINFCNYLIQKIEKSKSKKEINKIPLIVSNLSNYKWRHPNQKNITEKRNSIMIKYNTKLKKNKSINRWKICINPENIY